MNKFFLLLTLFVASLASMQAQITAPAPTEASTDEYPYAKYLQPIPAEADGHVYLERVVTLPENVNADETFSKMNDWVERCMKDSRIIQHAHVDATEPYTIRHQVQQEMVFSSKLLATDKSDFLFCLELQLKGNQIFFRMKRMSYRYTGDNPDRKVVRHTAEDYISDKVALNKKKDKLVLGYRKFRVKTIDLADEYTESLKMAFWVK